MKKGMVSLLLITFITFVNACGTEHNPVSPGTSGQANDEKNDYKRITTSNNQLGFDMLNNAPVDKNGNTFISPTSLLTALSMVYNGADGVTKEEMGNVLHARGMEINQLNKANASLMSMLHNNSKGSRLNVANSIWLNNRYSFQDEFSQSNREFYNAKIQEINPKSPHAPKTINSWVKKSTNGKIAKIVDENLDPDLVAILINAIYFKGKWQHAFNKELTEKRMFHLEDSSTKEMQFMTLQREMAYFENDQFQAASLPYAGGKMTMKIFLPKVGISLESFKKMLTTDQWEKWNSEFHKKEGTILLPKFQLRYEAEWSHVLENLGMTNAFNENAQFTKMIKENNPVWISEIKQKTYLNVNEQGTEAAAATSVGMKTTAARIGEEQNPFYMEVNHPFFMAITDNETDVILFMGSISNPREGKQ